MVTGRILYSMGAAFWNNLSPAYVCDVRETCNRCWSLHLNCLSTIFWDRNWVWYNGAMLWRALYAKHNTLNSISSCMANRWSWQRTGVICSYRLVFVIILVAVFCVLWMHWSWPCAIPYKIEFPASRWDLTNEWVAVYAASISRKGLIALTFFNLGYSDLFTEPTWAIILISLSNITPKLRTVQVGAMSIPLMLTWGI